MMCQIMGSEVVRLVSGVFKQNLYSSVLDSMHPRDIPPHLNFFSIDEEQFPLTKEIEEFILEARVETGDCLYIPNLYWR